MIKENIYLTKKSDKKIEFVTKDILLDEGVYIFFELNPGLYVLQKKQQQQEQNLHNSSLEPAFSEKARSAKIYEKKQETEKKDKMLCIILLLVFLFCLKN